MDRYALAELGITPGTAVPAQPGETPWACGVSLLEHSNLALLLSADAVCLTTQTNAAAMQAWLSPLGHGPLWWVLPGRGPINSKTRCAQLAQRRQISRRAVANADEAGSLSPRPPRKTRVPRAAWLPARPASTGGQAASGTRSSIKRGLYNGCVGINSDPEPPSNLTSSGHNANEAGPAVASALTSGSAPSNLTSSGHNADGAGSAGCVGINKRHRAVKSHVERPQRRRSGIRGCVGINKRHRAVGAHRSLERAIERATAALEGSASGRRRGFRQLRVARLSTSHPQDAAADSLRAYQDHAALELVDLLADRRLGVVESGRSGLPWWSFCWSSPPSSRSSCLWPTCRSPRAPCWACCFALAARLVFPRRATAVEPPPEQDLRPSQHSHGAGRHCSVDGDRPALAERSRPGVKPRRSSASKPAAGLRRLHSQRRSPAADGAASITSRKNSTASCTDRAERPAKRRTAG